jgi:hypothetical protein
LIAADNTPALVSLQEGIKIDASVLGLEKCADSKRPFRYLLIVATTGRYHVIVIFRPNSIAAIKTVTCASTHRLNVVDLILSFDEGSVCGIFDNAGTETKIGRPVLAGKKVMIELNPHQVTV